MRPGLSMQMFDTGPNNFVASCNPSCVKIFWDAWQPQHLPVDVLNWFRDRGIPLLICPVLGTGAKQEALLLSNPVAGAETFMAVAQSFYSRWPYWEMIFVGNEFGIDGWAENHSRFIEILAPKLWARNWTGGVYCFPTGNPASSPDFPPYEENPAAWLEDLRKRWILYLPGLYAAANNGHYLVLNQYAPGFPMDSPRDAPFHILRHELVWQILPKDLTASLKLVIGELGIDRDRDYPLPLRGWKAVCSPQQLADNIIWLAGRLGQFPAIKRGIFFGGWLPYFDSSFDIIGIPEIQQVLANLKDEEVQPVPETYKLHGRAEAMAWKHGDTSKVLTPPTYLIAGSFFVQVTQLRTYFWCGEYGTDIGWSVANEATMGIGDSFILNPK